MSTTAYLILENNTVFKGKSFGCKKETVGEVVFTTSMVGYLETLTDPGFYGQIVVSTFPLAGNYGIIPEDFESDDVNVKAYIVRQWCQEPSNFRSEGNLDVFLNSKGVTGLYDIDTRALTKIIRENGTMNGKIVYGEENFEKHMKDIKDYKIYKPSYEVSVKEEKVLKAKNSEYNVVLWDFGANKNITDTLLRYNCDVTIMPASSTAKDILDKNPDGVVLSNGPGNPEDYKEIVEEIKKLYDKKIPMFGIGLGHQLLALSNGAKTEKLKYGHRGANYPAKELETGKVHITNQNHGYVVLTESIPENARLSFVNVNDNTCEGIEYMDSPSFSVQFCPESILGPVDAKLLYEKFLSKMKEAK